MRITKLEHATLVVEVDNESLVIDPGKFTPSVALHVPLTAIVITHLHDDHWTPEHLTVLRGANPGVRVFGPAGVVAAAAASGQVVEQVSPGDRVRLEAFDLRFSGGQHAIIHASIPRIDNVGVLVNDELYYGGDAFDGPDGLEVGTLAAPAGAPWMKISESMDYVSSLAPRRAFGTHEAVLSEFGQSLSHARLAWATEQHGGEYHALRPGDSLEV